eukprot:TRINITY_DN28174_c0_g1_i1.p1 TRINITY_DN28174_c0_g1~~TRINITY_DN28174_c0_g1_i1.p1  ORF type:complete len:327 (-),score=55.13 TRINITY_DN28174_c0_g1_i1:186-1115(-)
MSAESWTTIESDPGVFTELIEQMGVKGVQVEELISLDAQELQALNPVYGLIFLFKWKQGEKTNPHGKLAINPPHNLFFANQVVPNACATQAVLSVLMNRPEIEIGEKLREFRDFVADFTPEIKGATLTNSETIRKAHNSFARPEPLIPDERQSSGTEDAYHFVAFVPVEGRLYELDGLQQAPIDLGECNSDNWLPLVCTVIQEKIQMRLEQANEHTFNLMAIIRNRKEVLLEQKQQLIQQGEDEEGFLIQSINKQIQMEEIKFQKWRDENIRRKHNYIPFIYNFLKILAKKGMLQPLIEQAQKQEQQNE